MKDSTFKTAFNTTSWFECGDRPFTSPVGSFDGQGLSWGPRQNNFGQGTLQPLLQKMILTNSQAVSQCFGPLYKDLYAIVNMPDQKAQLAEVIAKMNDPKNRLLPAWSQAFSALGTNVAMQNIFLDDAKSILPASTELATWMGGPNYTVRTFCVAFDIVNQDGNISTPLRLLLTSMKPLLAPFKKTDKDWVRFCCWARAAWTDFRGNQEFSQNVLARKLLIVDGHGRYGNTYIDAEQRFGITDEVA